MSGDEISNGPRLKPHEAEAIKAAGLVKRFGDFTALHGVDIEVAKGTVTAILGPNGAGKTTTVRILTTLSAPTDGQATVAGYDVVTCPAQVRRRIGLASQTATVDELLTGYENLVMIGELHHLGRTIARARATELLEQFDLVEAKDRSSGTYSGGMRRRLDLAATLVADPDILFLDEPTTGLDPRARQDLWNVLDSLVHSGTTVLLTTQYLEEAERLADDIYVIDHGTVIAHGTPRELKRQVGGEQLQAVVRDTADLDRAAAIIREAVGDAATHKINHNERSIVVATSDGVAALAVVASRLSQEKVALDDLGIRQPTLDEVFLNLTGQDTNSDSDPDSNHDQPTTERVNP